MQISKDKLKLILFYGVGIFLFNQFIESYTKGLSPFNQIFLLTSLQSKILHKSTIPETGEINSVAISPDGQTIVSRSKDNTIKVRDLKTGKLISTIAGNADDFRNVLISPNQQTVASSSKDGIQIWDLKTGSLKTTLSYKGNQGVSSLAFTPDGQTLVSNSNDVVDDPTQNNPKPIFNGKNVNTIEIWNLSTGKLKTTLKTDKSFEQLVAISPDGKTVVSSRSRSWDDITKRMTTTTMYTTIKIWDVNTRKVKNTLAETTELGRSIDTLTISPDGQTLVTRSGRNTVKIWDLNTGKLKATLPNPNNYDIVAVVFSPDGQTLLTSSWDGIKIWNLKTGSLKTTIATGDSLGGLAISSDGQTLVSNSFGTLLIWDLKTGKYKTALVNSNKEFVRSVAISPDGQTIVSSYWNWEIKPESIKIWQMP